MTDAKPLWQVRHCAVTESTNRDARAGVPGEVFTADLQTAGRGRLDHHWLSPPGETLLMSAVVGVADMPPEEREKLHAPVESFFVTRERGSGRPTKKERRELDALWDEFDND